MRNSSNFPARWSSHLQGICLGFQCAQFRAARVVLTAATQRLDDGWIGRFLEIHVGPNMTWLVVSTPLKNISQLGSLFPTKWKNKKCQTTNQNLKFDPFWFTGGFQHGKLWITGSWYIRNWQSADADALEFVANSWDKGRWSSYSAFCMWILCRMKTDGNPSSHHPKRMNHPVHPTRRCPGLAEHCWKLWVGRDFLADWLKKTPRITSITFDNQFV